MPRRILVVDDHEDTVETLRVLLNRWGYEARSVRSGEEALGAVADFHPHVMLLDLAMPGMSGLEVAERLRGSGGNIVLVAVTGFGQEEDRRRTSEAGFDHYLLKPVEPDQFRSLLNHIAVDRGA